MQKTIPDSTAVRVALWRAMHVLVDAAPHVLEDEVGLRLIAPDPNWRERGDMHPQGTRGYRASIVGRARLIEDMVLEQSRHGVSQYVILGAGLDTLAQRRPELSSKVRIFEVDQPETQEWKRQRLIDLGLGIPENLKLVPVNFEANESWWDQLVKGGFDPKKPSVVSSTGVSMYLTKEAQMATLKQMARLAPGSTLAMTFILTLDLIEPDERAQHEMVYERAKAAGTPFVSFYRPEEILKMAREAGFKKAEHIALEEIVRRYFAGRPDGLKPSSGEEFLIATT
jgi:methyltransferase (TIGR00027 family)